MKQKNIYRVVAEVVIIAGGVVTLMLGIQNALVASILVLGFSAVFYQGLPFRKGDVGI